MTAPIVSNPTVFDNPKNVLRPLALRMILWLLNRYARHGFHLSVDLEKPYVYQDGKPKVYAPMPPLNKEQKSSLRDTFKNLYEKLSWELSNG